VGQAGTGIPHYGPSNITIHNAPNFKTTHGTSFIASGMGVRVISWFFPYSKER